MDKKYTLILPVAGLSSRFGGKIKHFSKVGPAGETLIEYSLNQAKKAGFNDIIFIVGENTEAPFKEKFRNNYLGIPISYTKQNFDKKSRDKPWGPVDALCTTYGLVKNPFVVCNGDDIYGEEAFKTLINHIQKTPQNSATLGYKLGSTLPKEGSVNRGIYTLDNNSHVLKIKENLGITKNELNKFGLNETDMCSMNIFALNPDILEKLNNRLLDFKEKNKNSRTAESLLPTEISNLIDRGLEMICYPTNSQWYGVTNPEDEKIVREQIKLEQSV